MNAFPRDKSPQVQQPQHIGDILPDLLARYGLLPADAWRMESPQEVSPQQGPLPFAFAEISLPLSVS
jgi:hypothetical protein